MTDTIVQPPRRCPCGNTIPPTRKPITRCIRCLRRELGILDEGA